MKKTWLEFTQIGVRFFIVIWGSNAVAMTLMSDEWATAACEHWNQTPTLQQGLAKDWIRNDSGKGYKVIHLYRNECGETSKIEMRISFNDGNAYCVYGGKVENLRLNIGSDYLMHADTSRWIEMGNGEYGPMKAMMFGRLEFSGPKMEAMSVMGPFESFLQLIGKIPANNDACPSK